MTDAFARKPLGGSNGRFIEGFEDLSDDARRARSEEFKKRLADDKPVDDKPVNDMTVRARRNEHDKHNRAAGVRARLKSASLAARPPAKGSKG